MNFRNTCIFSTPVDFLITKMMLVVWVFLSSTLSLSLAPEVSQVTNLITKMLSQQFHPTLRFSVNLSLLMLWPTNKRCFIKHISISQHVNRFLCNQTIVLVSYIFAFIKGIFWIYQQIYIQMILIELSNILVAGVWSPCKIIMHLVCILLADVTCSM